MMFFHEHTWGVHVFSLRKRNSTSHRWWWRWRWCWYCRCWWVRCCLGRCFRWCLGDGDDDVFELLGSEAIDPTGSALLGRKVGFSISPQRRKIMVGEGGSGFRSQTTMVCKRTRSGNHVCPGIGHSMVPWKHGSTGEPNFVPPGLFLFGNLNFIFISFVQKIMTHAHFILCNVMQNACTTEGIENSRTGGWFVLARGLIWFWATNTCVPKDECEVR